MAIKKQEFYEGAALHLLVRQGGLASIRYEKPFFLVNDDLLVYLKYSTKGRSPWAFTFTKDEQVLLHDRAAEVAIVIGLICGKDGIVALTYEAYQSVAAPRKMAVHVACYRKHGEHYGVNGPDGALAGKVAPTNWQKLLDNRGNK